MTDLHQQMREMTHIIFLQSVALFVLAGLQLWSAVERYQRRH